MTAPPSPARDRWAAAARVVAPLLDDRTCVVILGERADDAARLAIALAHAQVHTRKVAIVDAVGELAPLQQLLPGDAGPYGVLDHFVHGVSLQKIAYAVNEQPLYVVPSGVGPFEYETLLRRERWRRLAMAFRSEGGLLCIVLPPDAEGLVAFVEDTDGVVLVGDVEYSEPRHVIANARASGRATADARLGPGGSNQPLAMFRAWIRKAPSKRAVLLAAVAALAGVGALFAWSLEDDARDQQALGVQPSHSPPSPAEAAAITARERDSASAALYSVDVVMVNSLSAADYHLKDRLGGMPAATFSPVRLGADSARWYRVLVGAWTDQQEADSALMAMRSGGVLQLGSGSVRRTPFAVRVADGLTSTAAMARAMELRTQGLPAYVLRRDGDHASVYAGAFETPSQATPLLDMFKRAGIDATVAYRLGRGI